MADIQEIKPHELLAIRQAVLRQGLPLEDSIFDGDYADSSAHFGAYAHGELIGCASLVANYTAKLEEDASPMMQLRGMAVLPEYRSKGVGAQLLQAAEKYARSKEINTLWFNARIKAVAFYERNGYLKKGDSYEIEGVGTHYFMLKKLTPYE
jgi:GNAT superfamily N-acetyltransferase